MSKILDMFKEDIKRNIANDTITKITLVDTESKKSATSAVGRGLVGGAVFGAVGLVGGAVSAKNKSTATFRIEYESGRIELKECKKSSKEYNKYMKSPLFSTNG